MRDKVTLLVRSVLEEYVQNKKNITEKQSTIFIILSSTCHNTDSVWQHISSLSLNHHVSLGITNQSTKIPEHLAFLNTINIEKVCRCTLLKHLDEVDSLYIPVISYSLVAKVALTIDDDILAWLVIQMQLKGKDILFANDVIKDALTIIGGSPVQKRVNTYLRQLVKDGIYIHPMARMEQKIPHTTTKKTPLLLEKHIEALHKSGEREIILPRKSVITPLGKDRARELGITIQRGE